jgi:prephenate dehydrogenase
MKIAVLGAGRMGAWFAKFYKEQGYSVIVADRKKEKAAKLGTELGVKFTDFEEAAKKADWILICVSINAMEAIVKRISPVVREDQIVMDIASIKEDPVKIMHEHIKTGVVLGTHPVFGPGSKGVEHKAFILTPTNAKEKKFAENFKSWLEMKNARVFVMSPKRHDELISVVLGLPHFLGLVVCDTLLEQANFSETKKVAGTTYRMLFTLAEATALENPELFATLQLNLPEIEKIEKEFMKKSKEWLDIIKRKDQSAIIKKMEQLKTKLMKSNPDFARSYETMYKMLEATENSNNN